MEEPTPLRITGSDGKFLQLRFLRRSREETVFLVALHGTWLTAETEMTTYVYGPPTTFFDEMAASWRGWEGEKAWAEIEGRVSFHASSDRCGHIELIVSLRADPASAGRVQDVIKLEAGGLEYLARRIHKFFDAHAI
jgi:hypothetical protein